MQSQPNERRSPRRCMCRPIFKYKSYGHSRLYDENSLLSRWGAAGFSSSLNHRRDCVLFLESKECKQFGLRISFSGPFLMGAIQAAMSMTRGFGRFSISPSLSFNSVVPSNSEQFRLLHFDFDNKEMSVADVRTNFEFRRQEILRQYQEGNASPYDIDENGNNVMHVSLWCKQPFSLRGTLKVN